MFEKEADSAETKMLVECHGDYSKKKGYKEGYQEGAVFGFQECAKSRLNITTISDCPIKEDDKFQQAMKQIHSLLYVYQLGKNELATARIRAEAEQFLKDNNYFN